MRRAEPQCIERGPWVNIDLNSRVTDAVLHQVGSGRTDPSTGSIRWCFFDAGASRTATRARSKTRPSLLRSRSGLLARRKLSGCGSSSAKARSSGEVVNQHKARGGNDILIAGPTGSWAFRKRSCRCLADGGAGLHRPPDQLSFRVREGAKRGPARHQGDLPG